jgi:hypothetical protein
MKKFVFVSNGEPVSTIIPSDGKDISNGVDLFEVPFDLQDEYIYSHVYFDDGILKYRPQRPGQFFNWTPILNEWVPDLDAARESQRQAWNAWRDRELIAGYPHNGHVFHSDDRFMAELQLILKGYERGHLTGTSAIRTKDNGTLQMTHAEIEGLLLLIGLHRQAIYAQSWVGKDALASLTTLEDIVAGGPPS